MPQHLLTSAFLCVMTAPGPLRAVSSGEPGGRAQCCLCLQGSRQGGGPGVSDRKAKEQSPWAGVRRCAQGVAVVRSVVSGQRSVVGSLWSVVCGRWLVVVVSGCGRWLWSVVVLGGRSGPAPLLLSMEASTACGITVRGWGPGPGGLAAVSTESSPRSSLPPQP